jgi:Trypsin-like peptidase domain
MAVYFGYGKASRSAFRGTTYAMAAILVTLALQSAAQERAIDGSQDDPSNLVVVIERRLGETDGLGAGLISGYKDDMVYIATANHTVRWGREQAAEIEILFKRVPERRVRASLLERFDTSLDLAVLAVSVRDTDFLDPKSFPQAPARDAQFVSRGAALHSIGHPNGQLWWKNVTQDRLAEVLGDVVRFESFSLAQGHSGGALVNSDNEIIGMIRADQLPTGVALNIQTLRHKFSEWSYPVSSWTFPADIGGNWVVSVPHGHLPRGISWPDEKQEFRLRYDGQQITGEVTSIDHNEHYKIRSGKIHGNLVTFQIENGWVDKSDGRRCPMTQTYAGEVQRDSLQLNLTVAHGAPCNDGYSRGSFVAKRRPSAN